MNQANAVPPSQSGSTRSQTSNIEIKQSESTVSLLFPLFSAVFQNAKIPVAFSMPFLLIFFFQALCVSYWPWDRYWSVYNNNKSIKILKEVFFFVPQPATPLGFIILSCIIFGINLITCSIIAFQVAYYHSTRKFINFLNYPIRAYFDTILVGTLVPCLVDFGECFLLVAKGSKDVMVIVSMILFFFSLLFEVSSFILVQSFAAKSICINPSPMLNFDPTIMTSTLIAMIVSILSFFLLLLFEDWAPLFAIVIHIGIYIYEVYYLEKHLPFVDVFTDSMSFGWFTGCLIGDVLMFILHFATKVNFKIPMILIFISFLFFTFVGLIINTIKTKKIVSVMMKVNKSQEDANEYYREHNLDQDMYKCILYFKIAFQNYCPCFYDMTLANFIAENYDEEIIIATVLQIITFFPMETRLQSRFQLLLMKRRKLSISAQFLLFQIEAIKSLRQFSASSMAKLKLVDLKTMSRNCENMTKSGIDMKEGSIDYFEQLAQKTNRARVIWIESLMQQPNNARFYEEYTRYLIEAESDFKEGLAMKNKQTLLEAGANFSIDLSFRSMVENFPKYLTEGIIDTKGKILQSQHKGPKESSSSTNNSISTNNSQSSSGSQSTELDDSVMEFLGKSTLKMARSRLALHSMLETKIPLSVSIVKPVATIIVIYVLVMFISFDIYTNSVLKEHAGTMKFLEYFSQTRFNTALSNINIIIEYGREHGIFDQYNNQMLKMFKSDDHYYIDMLVNMLPLIVTFTTSSSGNFSALVNLVTNYSLQGFDISPFEKALWDSDLSYYICGPTGNVTGIASVSFQSVFAGLAGAERTLSGYDNIMDAMHDPNACEISTNFQTFHNGATYVSGNISSYQIDRGNAIKHTLLFLSVILPTITFLILFIPVIVIHFSSNKMLSDIMGIINTIDSKEKAEARENIMMQNNEQSSIIETKTDKGPSTGILAVICLMSILTLAMTLISGLYINKLNTNIKHLNGWNIYSAMRISLLAESLNMLVSCVIVHDYPYNFTWSSMADLVSLTYYVTNKLIDADTKLINGSDTTIPIQGFDETLDEINIYDSLMENSSTLDPQDYYNNLSAHSLIGVYASYVDSILTQITNDQNLSVTDVANAIYIPNDRLFYKLILSRKRCSELATVQLSKLRIFYIIIAVCVIFCVGVYITFVAMYYNNRLSTYRAALFIVKRFSPYVLLANKMFNKVFLKGSNLKNNKKMSIEGSIIQNANDSILGTSIQGTVETVNDSVQRLLGYTPEQLLGQKVDLFFANADGETLRQKLEMMKEGQISQFYEDDFTAISDTTQEIPVHTSIIGMIKENETKINSFVIILRDQTALVKQKKQAEDAKAKSEKLLYQILPRDIVLQLNKGEKDISFVVPAATIIFVDINRFSEYAANLSPQDIMANLSLYFACMDKMASRHNMIQKIKLIGDIYMAATGLFNPDSPPESHAEQSIIFGFECIQALDEINMRLEANLAIRIGINSGGPIIAGVLGTDKPVFDIIGDAINIAARLQTTCEINHVHISQATYDLVKDMNFELTKRGETFLKGKGKQMTYYAASNSFVLNHSDISV